MFARIIYVTYETRNSAHVAFCQSCCVSVSRDDTPALRSVPWYLAQISPVVLQCVGVVLAFLVHKLFSVYSCL
jgi:hypothetical protein